MKTKTKFHRPVTPRALTIEQRIKALRASGIRHVSPTVHRILASSLHPTPPQKH